MTGPTFGNMNGLFVQSFKVGDNDPTRDYFGKYYMLLVEIKDFNQTVNNKQEAYKKAVEISRNDDYTTWNV